MWALGWNSTSGAWTKIAFYSLQAVTRMGSTQKTAREVSLNPREINSRWDKHEPPAKQGCEFGKPRMEGYHNLSGGNINLGAGGVRYYFRGYFM